MSDRDDASEINDYSKDIEDLFISFMMSNKDLFVRCKGIIKSTYFDDRQNRDTIAFIEGYSTAFSIIPSLDEIKAVTKKDIRIMEVDAAVHGDRRLGRSGASERGQRGQGEQRSFHCDYLLG